MPANTAAKLNLADVAALAGVSTPTVSKVINGRDDVAEATRARVQEALGETGLRVADAAPGQVHRAGLGGPGLRWPGQFVLPGSDVRNCGMRRGGGCGDCAQRREARPSSEDVDHEQWSQRLAESGRKGLIFVTSVVTAGQLESFRRRNIPVVVIDPLSPPGSGYVSIGATNWAGGKAATEHLIGLGHRKIAFLGGPEAVECSVARLHGYLAALRASGLPANPDYVLPGRFNRDSGVAGARQLLALADPPTAIFAANDVIALGVLDEARRQGIRVPEAAERGGLRRDGPHRAVCAPPDVRGPAAPGNGVGGPADGAAAGEGRNPGIKPRGAGHRTGGSGFDGGARYLTFGRLKSGHLQLNFRNLYATWRNAL